MPAGRLTVVILTDERSRDAFNANPRPEKIATKSKRHLVIPGHYESATNRIVIRPARQRPQSTELWDLTHLAHEATHQLTFNTGLLVRRGDVPHCIAEGLASYGEIRKPTGQMATGEPHRRYLSVLVHARRSDIPWYPVDQLIADDRPFLSGSFSRLQALAYAQAWLLIDYFMRDRSRLERLQAYLEAIRPRVDPEHRLDDAEKHLGDLDRLNQDLLTYFVKLNKSL